MRLHPDVYEPAEDTHLLLRALREREPDVHGRSCADVGTGTGAVAMALAASGARVVAVDVSPLAVRLAAENLEAQGPGCRGRVLRGHLLSALRGPFDVVTFNAPYLPSAPGERVPGWLDRAFHGGEGGVEVSEAFVRDLPRVLAPGGRAYLVVSSRADLERLAATAREAGLRHDPVGSARFFFEEVAVWRLERG